MKGLITYLDNAGADFMDHLLRYTAIGNLICSLEPLLEYFFGDSDDEFFTLNDDQYQCH